MISATGISLHFGEKTLFDDISFQIGPKDRIGLVGSNGAGKSTLLRLLLGEQTPERGVIAKAKYVTVGYLPQEGMSAAGKTLYEEAESVFGDVVRTREDLDGINLRMGEIPHDTEEFQELLALFGELQHKLEDSDAFRMKSKIEKVLLGLGFTERDLDRPTVQFSGGWQMRIALARLLLQQPSLLLLDEPTNHLDLDSLEWLEDYLRTYDGAVMIVSHDSRFLDTMSTRTCELSLGKLTEYAGNYTFFLKAKAERAELQISAYKNQQQQIKQTQRFIERFRYKATKARQVQSRVKALEKMDLVELEDEEGAIRFEFPPAPPSGRAVLELRGITKSYGTMALFKGLDFDIDRGDRIAFVGVNGAGKSTLARIIAGVEPFDAGERRVGHNVAVSYFAQHQAEELDPTIDALDTVEHAATGEIRKRLRSLLGSFLFKGDDVFKKVSVLSGGEKSRLALAKMLLHPANLIVLDEPTNHLDMRSKAVLLDALMDYEGSCVIVSHDRDFLDPLVNKVIEFHGGKIKTYLGNVTEYIEKRARDEAVRSGGPGKDKAANELSAKSRKRQEAEQRQHRYARVKPIKMELEKAEKSIERLEKEKAEVEVIMADPEFYKNGERVKTITATYAAIEKSLSAAYFRWNELTKKLEVATAAEPPGNGR